MTQSCGCDNLQGSCSIGRPWASTSGSEWDAGTQGGTGRQSRAEAMQWEREVEASHWQSIATKLMSSLTKGLSQRPRKSKASSKVEMRSSRMMSLSCQQKRATKVNWRRPTKANRRRVRTSRSLTLSQGPARVKCQQVPLNTFAYLVHKCVEYPGGWRDSAEFKQACSHDSISIFPDAYCQSRGLISVILNSTPSLDLHMRKPKPRMVMSLAEVWVWWSAIGCLIRSSGSTLRLGLEANFTLHCAHLIDQIPSLHLHFYITFIASLSCTAHISYKWAQSQVRSYCPKVT